MFETERYYLIRFFFNGGNTKREVLREDLTLQAVEAHCNDPETSSKSCTSDEGRARTAEHGDWFDGFERTDDDG